jgi:glycolate oxidase
LLMVEFDVDLEEADNLMRRHLQEMALNFRLETEPKRQVELWRVRENMLLWIMGTLETEENRFPPLADDLAVPVERLPEFILEIQGTLKRYGSVAVIFGHIGEGNLHIRPMIGKENREVNLRRLSDLIFSSALKWGGTITGEHGLGRNRSKYLRDEWGDRIYSYFCQVKNIFDPADLLNPGIVFTAEDLTWNLKL